MRCQHCLRYIVPMPTPEAAARWMHADDARWPCTPSRFDEMAHSDYIRVGYTTAEPWSEDLRRLAAEAAEAEPPTAEDLRAALARCDMADEDEWAELPHVLLAFDPEGATTAEPWRGCGATATGCYPDRLSALAAADAYQAQLNAGLGPDEQPWKVLALALYPTSDQEAPMRQK